MRYFYGPSDYFDPIVGHYQLPDHVSLALNSDELRRLHYIDHTGIPHLLLRRNPGVSKWQHSATTAYGATCLPRIEPFIRYQREIECEAAIHDGLSCAGTHNLEKVMVHYSGVGHEEMQDRALSSASYAESWKERGISLEIVRCLHKGCGLDSPVCRIINGGDDWVDLDSWIGTLQFTQAELKLNDKPPYDPILAIGHLTVINGQLALQGDPDELIGQIEGYFQCRRNNYAQRIYTPGFLGISSAFQRACHLACKEGFLEHAALTRMDDREIVDFLANAPSIPSRAIMALLRHGWPPRPIARWTYPSEHELEFVNLKEWGRYLLADYIEQHLDLASGSIMVAIERNKGYKKTWPIYDTQGRHHPTRTKLSQYGLCEVYVYDDLAGRIVESDELERCMLEHFGINRKPANRYDR